MEEQRVYFLDYLRVIALFLVLIVHASETFYGSEILVPDQDTRLWLGIWDGIARVSVPLFMVCSAFLLAPLKEGQSWGDFFRRRAKRILPPMFIFFVLYSVLPVFWGASTWKEAWQALSYIPLNFPMAAGHLWFMYPLIGLYLFIPFISPWLKVATERQERLFLILWALSTCIPYLNRWFGDVWGQCWWNQYDMLYNFAGYPGYLVMAHYIKNHIHWDDAKRRLTGLICLIVGAVATILSFYVQIVPGTAQSVVEMEIGWCFCTINCVVYTFGAFLLFTTIHKPGKCYKLVYDISKVSYGMFLIHMFWLWLLAPVITPHLHISLAIPAIALATYICSYISCKLISLIPGSRWVIG
ncbi:MAG: acyltransferase [Bacteroidales bacterium]|nr:acyltransferase [Bacteroidales bacterium]